MNEEYDKAWAKYQKSLKIIPVPLLSWDISGWKNPELTQFESIQKHWQQKVNFYYVLNTLKKEIIVTNKNFEIVFANERIIEMNGYRPDEIIGKSPRIFQGDLTSDEVRKKIKTAMTQQKPFKEVLLNYRKDGSTYFCEVEAYPKFSPKGEFLNFIAFENITTETI